MIKPIEILRRYPNLRMGYQSVIAYLLLEKRISEEEMRDIKIYSEGDEYISGKSPK